MHSQKRYIIFVKTKSFNALFCLTMPSNSQNTTFCGTSASSITTRIKTNATQRYFNLHHRVQVHHPLQQGLRHQKYGGKNTYPTCTSASSITTRIKTNCFLAQFVQENLEVQVHHPLQQGLRHYQYSILGRKTSVYKCIIHYNKD